jgi:hypothetical protein
MGTRNRQVMPETVGKVARLRWKARCTKDCSVLEEGGGEGEEEEEEEEEEVVVVVVVVVD